MHSNETDLERRKFLTAATSVIGGVGVGMAALPFVGSWLPSEKAKALGAPVEIDVSKIESGQKVTVSWRGQPIFIVNRSKSVLPSLADNHNLLRDPYGNKSLQPDYIKGDLRSIKEQYLIVTGLCTHLGCVPLYKPKKGSVDASWTGGFFCPCHGSKFDFSGRVYKGVPAPTNLSIPPHRYLNDNVVLIGED